MKNLKKFQSKHLFLLAGTNPLPNYVATRLLLKPGGHLYLVHTNETSVIADRLITKLDLVPGRNATKIEVDEARSDSIFEQVAGYAKGVQDVGLNYTGGTKTMAVHAYRALEQNCPDAVFSYLDAMSLIMIIAKNGQPQQEFPVALAVTPCIQTLLALHGYTLEHDPAQDAMHPEVCQELAKDGIQWRNWCDQNLRSGPYTPFRKQAELSTVSLPCWQTVNWQGCHTLGELAAKWTMKDKDIAEWLDGKWLEDYTLWALQQIASECKIHQVRMNIKPQERNFEFDVVAMRGYQLFALSCSTEYKKGKLKLKLFEAYVRARQMGGDEARVGLVCCAPKDNPDSSPSAIQREIEEEWDAQGKVRVFGAEHLPDLPAYLKDWFNSQPQ